MEGLKKNISKIFFRLISFISRAKFFKKMEIIKEYEFKAREEIEEFQFLELKNLLEVAYKEVPFYRKKFKANDITPNSLKKLSDLEKFPIVSKSEIRHQYREMINKRNPIDTLKKTQSSGSTGEPKVFYYDKVAYGWRLASQFYGWKRAGFEFGEKWLRISMAERNTLFYKIFNFFSRCSYIGLTEFGEEKYDEVKRVLESKKPVMIYSYASALYLISDYLDKQGCNYNFVKSIIVQGDICFPKYREKIEKVFNTKVFDTYGGDGVIISGQCTEGNHHVLDLGVIIEIVDDNYNILTEGEVGKVLITDLHNTVMPLIRYEIGDLGVRMSINCKCGSKFSTIRSPIGRDTDVIKLSNGITLFVHYFTFLFEYYSEILQFQVREIWQDELLIYLKVTENFSDKLRQEIESKIMNYCKGGVKTKIELVKEIPLERSNKRRLVIGKS
jgi:phenylacetate-CoA ligase